MYTVSMHPRAYKELEEIPEELRNQIRQELGQLESNPRPGGSEEVRSTSNDVKPAYKIRQGSYRIVYRFFPDLKYVLVLIADIRADVYDEFVMRHKESRQFILNNYFGGKEPKAKKEEKISPQRQRELDRKENNKKKRRGSLEESLDWLKEVSKI